MGIMEHFRLMQARDVQKAHINLMETKLSHERMKLETIERQIRAEVDAIRAEAMRNAITG